MGGVTIDGVAVAVPPALAVRCHAFRCHAVPSGPGRVLARYVDRRAIRLTDRQVFVIGDNVDMSFDSRMDGPPDVSDVVDLIYGQRPPGRAPGR